ncbi:MAG TPA: CPBP family intramembrane glutamic endopeptidase [Micropepsaceae bacterium]|nr:CPBP family intramembrane glutamic endopeptidase [Micropepsaceae bacterium]
MELAPTIPAIELAVPPSGQRRLRWGPWATLAWAVPIVVVMVLFQTIGALGFLRWWNLTHPHQQISVASISSNGAVLAFSLLVSAPPILAVLGLAARLSRAPVADYLALKWPRPREIGVGAALLVAVLVATSILADVTGQEAPAFITDTFNTARDAGMLPLLVLTFVFLGPLQEELIFRGFLFRGFAPAFGMWPTILVTATLWSVIHVQYQWFFVAEIFALGVLFGWLRAWSGSLLLTFGLHATVNAMAVVEAAALMTGT